MSDTWCEVVNPFAEMAVEGKVKGGVAKKVDTAFKKPLPKGGEAKEAVKEEVKAEAPLVKLSDSQMSEALTAFTKLLAIQVLQLYILADNLSGCS